MWRGGCGRLRVMKVVMVIMGELSRSRVCY